MKLPRLAATGRMRTRRERRIARHARLAAVHERALAHDLARILDRIARAAADHVAAGQPQVAAGVVDHYQDEIMRAFRARLLVAAQASAKLVLDELTGEKALPGVFETKFIDLIDVAMNTVTDWLANYAAEKVVKVLDTTKRIIRRAISRGTQNNEAPRDMAKRVQIETGGEIGRARAITISRTETHTATQIGAEAAATATGLDLDKEWGATEDARTRPAHAAADGQTVAKDETFTVDGEALDFPGDPNGSPGNVINCRCITLWRPRIPT